PVYGLLGSMPLTAGSLFHWSNARCAFSVVIWPLPQPTNNIISPKTRNLTVLLISVSPFRKFCKFRNLVAAERRASRAALPNVDESLPAGGRVHALVGRRLNVQITRSAQLPRPATCAAIQGT